MTTESDPRGRKDPTSNYETAGATIGNRIDRLPHTRVQTRIFLVLALAWLCDSLDLNSTAYLLAPVRAQFHLTAGETGWLASSALIGMAVGALSSGRLADRYGRRRLLELSIVTWGLATVGAAAAQDFSMFVIFRGLTGIGMGAQFPVALSLLSEFIPKNRRGKLIIWMGQGGGAVASIIAGALSISVLEALSWRGLLGIEAAFAVIVLLVRRGVPESPRWYESQGRLNEAESALEDLERRTEAAYGRALPAPQSTAPINPIHSNESGRSGFRALFDKPYRSRTIMACLVTLLVTGFGYYALQSWIAELLVERGFSIQKSTVFVLLMNCWQLVGAITAGYLVERIGRKLVVCLFAGAAVVIALFYGIATSDVLVIVLGSALQFVLFGMFGGVNTYLTELFPTRIRSTGVGTANFTQRVGGIAGPLAVPIVIGSFGLPGVFIFVGALPFAIGLVLVAVLGPETKGRSLEDLG